MTETPRSMFSRRLREHRRAAGLTQAGLADLISERIDATLDGTAITRIERGERGVKLEEAVAAAQALRIPLAALVSDEPAEDARLRELHTALERERGRMAAAEEEMRQATAAMVHIEQEMERLEASRGD